MISQLETDYLIIGSGAVGLAFADVILNETNANIVIVDKHHKPGGHWNDAYSFVALHQPSAFYGVSSKELSNGKIEQIGLNKGLANLASGAQVLSYFDDLMHNHFLPSGRVQYFPMCEYKGEGQFSSLLSNQQYHVKVNKKTVDGTYFKTSVPSTHTSSFNIDPKANFCTLNELPKLSEPHSEYVVVGGGKTGIDAVLWLLENQVDPDDIAWVMPRDAWFFDRKNTQPMQDFFEYSIGSQAAQLEALAKSQSIDELFNQLEQAGCLCRLDSSVKPKMFHGATMSQQELTELRRVKGIIRMGRVTKLLPSKLVLEHGEYQCKENSLFIDCSASAVPKRDTVPVFTPDTVTIQTVRTVQPVFSAAFIAHIEACYGDEELEKKNHLCTVVPLPNHDTDWIRVTAAQMVNQFQWSQEPGIKDWLVTNRLDGFSAILKNADKEDPKTIEIVTQMREYAGPAFANVQNFLRQLDHK